MFTNVCFHYTDLFLADAKHSLRNDIYKNYIDIQQEIHFISKSF